MRIVVNWSRCDGNGLCTRQAPKLLAIDEHDQLHVLQEISSEEERAAAERAVKVCPKAALSIADAGSESGGSQQ